MYHAQNDVYHMDYLDLKNKQVLLSSKISDPSCGINPYLYWSRSKPDNKNVIHVALYLNRSYLKKLERECSGIPEQKDSLYNKT